MRVVLVLTLLMSLCSLVILSAGAKSVVDQLVRAGYSLFSAHDNDYTLLLLE